MYIKDLVTQIVFIVQNNRNDSGIYNICNTKSIVLKELVLQLAALIGVSESLLKFGCIPYRPGQNMFISGDNSKFKKTFCFNEKDLLGLATGLKKTIEYYKKKA